MVAYRLRACERDGLIVREARLSRAITLTAEGRALAGLSRSRSRRERVSLRRAGARRSGSTSPRRA
ncbi:MAG: hypothetical protein OXG61_10695 [Chloroflexi bacterium]|nr:hypothetical protein [Chloroflexota bacterium]